MFGFTTKKPEKVTDTYFPIGIDKEDKKAIYIRSIDYKDYEEKQLGLLRKHISDESKVQLVADLMQEGKLPKEYKLRMIAKSAKEALDEYFGKEYNGKDIVKTPNVITRDAINVYGAAGSGKSYWTAEFVRNYKKYLPKKPIFLITCNQAKDKNYEGLGMKVLNCNDIEDFDDVDFDETEFKNSLVIFDDIETKDKDLFNWIKGLRDMLLEKARKHETDVINIIHKGRDSHNTKIPNIEANGAVVFPRFGWSNTAPILSTYFELTDEQLKKIHKLRTVTRAVYISKQFPKYALYDKGAILLEDG